MIDEALERPSAARQARGRTKDAHEVLAPVYDRFAEGFSTANLVSAKTFLDALR